MPWKLSLTKQNADYVNHLGPQMLFCGSQLGLPLLSVLQSREQSKIIFGERIQGIVKALQGGRLLAELLADSTEQRANARRLGIR